MNYQQLLELHTTLHHTLNFLKSHSDSPEELDNRVRKQIQVVEAELQTYNPEFESILLYL